MLLSNCIGLLYRDVFIYGLLLDLGTDRSITSEGLQQCDMREGVLHKRRKDLFSIANSESV